MNLELVQPIGPYHAAAGTAQNTFTTKKDVSPAPLSVIPAGQLRRMSKLRLRANGEFSTTGTPNLTMGFWLGTRAGSITADVALSSVIVTASGAAAFPWIMEWDGFCNLEGTSGTLLGSGQLSLGSSLTAFSSPVPIPITQALRTVTIDTTVERAFGVSATWGTSSVSNSITVYYMSVEILN